jgi:hypothetical protein
MTPVVAASKVFPFPLMGQWDLSGERFTTTCPFVYDDAAKGWRVYVPAGLETDFSSIPRVVWAWFPKTQFPAAGVVHDHLYRHPYAFVGGVRVRLSRGQCDDMWRRVLDLSGCRRTKRLSAWLGLRAGGWAAWNKYREAEGNE